MSGKQIQAYLFFIMENMNFNIKFKCMYKIVLFVWDSIRDITLSLVHGRQVL